MAVQAGQTVQGYELLERIGAGGFGAVYRAYQSVVGREVAVKIILPAYANKPAFIRRFEIEAQLVARLEHLHIVPVYDFWRDPQGAYIIMRWLRGGSLSAALRKQGGFDLEAASVLIDQVSAGLSAAHHQQIVHRDLRPSNVLLDEEGNAYLADFGIAKDQRRSNGNDAANSRETTLEPGNEEQTLRSVQYLSPEQLVGQQATPLSDIYSLGITLYELLSGQHPFPGLDSVQQLYKHIDEPLPRIDLPDTKVEEAVNEVIQKATAKNPKLRFQDALAMATAFRASASLQRDDQSFGALESLTLREQEILHFIIEGNTNQQIAQTLFLELSTVKWHINRIYKKLKVRSRVQAIVKAREMDLIVSANERELESGGKTNNNILLPELVNPYKGLRAFDLADARDFFGREALVDHLLSRLSPIKTKNPIQPAFKGPNHISERFLAIVGPSGSGKSSLIKAGLISALISGRLAGSEKWFVVEMLPGTRPLDNLEIALSRIAGNQAGNLREQLDRDSHGLLRAAKLILPNDESELVLVIDQFEELYTLVADESARNHLIDLIQEAVSDPHSRIRVVISLRADYYDRPLQHPVLGELVHKHLETLLPLTAEELERVIVNPAHQIGVTFETGLVATIIEEVNYRPGALPLLQFTLAELFEQREGRTLTKSAYMALGGITGALAKRAEELYQEQGADGREAIRQLFLRLVSIGDQHSEAASGVRLPEDTRERVLRSELLSATSDPESLDEIIDTYATYRLLTLDHDAATRLATVEVAHEAILREWDRLQGWIGESLDDLSQHRQLAQAARDWIEAGSDQSFLLRGARLENFESWVDDTQLALTQNERDFFANSLALNEEKAAVERERQDREEHLERQSNRRLKAVGTVLAVALVATIFFAVRINTQRKVTESRRLTAAAVANLEMDPELSILLALEAIETISNVNGEVVPELEELLHKAVQADRTKITIPMIGLVSFSPDGKLLAIGASTGDLSVWDTNTGLLIHQLEGHTNLISGLSFNSEGTFLASSSFDGHVRIWDLASGKVIASITGHVGQVNDATFSPDGEQLATVDPKAIRIWDLSSLYNSNSDVSRPIEISEPAYIQATPRVAHTVIFSPDGQRVAARIIGQGVIVWKSDLAEQILEIPSESAFVSGIAFSPNGEYLAGGSEDLGVILWNSETGEQIAILSDTAPITGVVFSQDSRMLAVAAKNGMVSMWDLETHEQTIRISGQRTGFNFIALSPDGRYVAAGNGPESTSIWDVGPSGERELLTISAHKGKVYDAIYNADGTRIASSGEDGRARIWDSITGEMLHDLPAYEDWAHFPAFSPDSQQLAVVNRDGGISIWDTNTGRELLALPGDAAAITAITYSPDGSRLAAGGFGGLAHIWDTVTGKRLRTIHNPYEISITELVYSLGGDQLFSYDLVGTSIAWDGETGERSMSSSTGAVCEATLWDAEISSDGQLQAIASFDGSAYVYQAVGTPESGTRYKTLHNLIGHEGVVTGVAFNPEGTTLASSGFDGTIRLWDMDTADMFATLTNQPIPLEGVDFSPDGRHVVSAGDDGTLRIFIVSFDELIQLARERLSRGLSQLECQTYLDLPTCVED